MSSNDPARAQATRGVGADGLIHGKVAQLLNVRQLALNVGYKHGVAQGMHFAVLNRNAGDIRDPDTHEILGSAVLPKLHVTVTTVQAEFCIANVVGARYVGGLGMPSIFFEGREVPLTLRRADHPGVEEIDAKDSIVQIGDPVVQELVIEPTK